jgi:hypothetical protein
VRIGLLTQALLGSKTARQVIIIDEVGEERAGHNSAPLMSYMKL